MTDSNRESQGRRFPLILILAAGFAGGVVANFGIAALKWVPEVDDGHPLFGAPFLTFLGIVLLVAIFYHPLRTLLSRGTLKIKWGDREISITDIEENVDTQFNEFESKLANIVDDIEEFKRSTLKVEEGEAEDEEERTARGPGILEAIKGIFPEASSDELASIIYHLGSTEYKWRNQATLSKRTRLTGETIDSLVLSAPGLIVRSRAKSGNTIYRLTTEAKGKLLQVTRGTV